MSTLATVLLESDQSIELAMEQIRRTLPSAGHPEGYEILKEAFLGFLSEADPAGHRALRKAIQALDRVNDPPSRHEKLLRLAAAFLVANDHDLLH